jgi:hypothetical protein
MGMLNMHFVLQAKSRVLLNSMNPPVKYMSFNIPILTLIAIGPDYSTINMEDG